MKLFRIIDGLKRSNKNKANSSLFLNMNEFGLKRLTDNIDRREALIQNGRQQFKKLQELGLQLPIAAL